MIYCFRDVDAISLQQWLDFCKVYIHRQYNDLKWLISDRKSMTDRLPEFVGRTDALTNQQDICYKKEKPVGRIKFAKI